ncbi:cytochrome P450 [Xylariaceae sp. FL0016]|nr:cytochrome P450 [Xylariaceae sp. FL0016]
MEPSDFPFKCETTYQPPSEYARLQQGCPISRVKLPSGNEVYLLTKHADITAALSSTDLSADKRTPGYPELHREADEAKDMRPNPTFEALDDPAHATQRQSVEAVFSEEQVGGMRGMIHGVMDDVLDTIAKTYVRTDQGFDLVAEFAVPVPTRIMCQMLGISDSDAV